MQVLVVHAHPSRESFSHSLRDAAVAGLLDADHRVDVIDLYADGFEPALTEAERRAYDSDDPILDDRVRGYAGLVAGAGALVFVYPTWWWGLPAVLKGWLDRVLVPGVAFTIQDGKPVPGLRNVRHLVGITTYGSSSASMRLFNDAGKRTITRSLRTMSHRRAKTTWLGLYEIDESEPDQRAEFLTEVERTMASL